MEKQNLLICGSVPLHSRDAIASVVFSDGNHLGTISPAKEVQLHLFTELLIRINEFESEYKSKFKVEIKMINFRMDL